MDKEYAKQTLQEALDKIEQHERDLGRNSLFTIKIEQYGYWGEQMTIGTPKSRNIHWEVIMDRTRFIEYCENKDESVLIEQEYYKLNGIYSKVSDIQKRIGELFREYAQKKGFKWQLINDKWQWQCPNCNRWIETYDTRGMDSSSHDKVEPIVVSDGESSGDSDSGEDPTCEVWGPGQDNPWNSVKVYEGYIGICHGGHLASINKIGTFVPLSVEKLTP